MSAADLVSVLFFDEMRFDPRDPGHDADLFVLSRARGAHPLVGAKEAGAISEDLLTLRRYDSVLEGHPTPRSPVRVATGSLGQGLSTSSGMAWRNKLGGLPGRVYCLCGDGEMAGGSVWEAGGSRHTKLDNLCAIVDEPPGQAATMHQHGRLRGPLRAFGWDNGRRRRATSRHPWRVRHGARTAGKPFAIVARTFKGRGVSFRRTRKAGRQAAEEGRGGAEGAGGAG
jgi:transketolase